MIIALCTDSTDLGKVDKASLSQQTLMEVLVGEMEDNDIICRGTESAIDWSFVLSDNTGDINDIAWEGIGLKGVIDLRWLPVTLERFSVTTNQLSGTLELTALPPLLKSLDVGENNFFGTLDLTQLPDSLQDLAVRDNNLSGTLDFTNLPRDLLSLLVNENGFSGYADFSLLPENNCCFDVSSTQLEGEIGGHLCTKECTIFIEDSNVKFI